jgi:hypothetical protein
MARNGMPKNARALTLGENGANVTNGILNVPVFSFWPPELFSFWQGSVGHTAPGAPAEP